MIYRTIVIKLTNGETKDFTALRYLSLVSATGGAVSLGVYGTQEFGAFVARQVLGDELADLGRLVIRNDSGVDNTITMVTSDRRISWMDVSGSSITITGCAIDIPIKYTGAEGAPTMAGEVSKASGVLPVESYLAGFQTSDSKWYPVLMSSTRGLTSYNDDIGAKADAVATTDTGTFSLIALIKRLFSKLPASLGQTTMANSLSVTIASNQGNLPCNIAQMNGVTVSMGSGTNGTGVQRVTLATDQAACSVAGLFSVKMDQTTDASTNAVVDKPVTVAAAALSTTLMAGMTTNVVKASAGNLYGFSVINKDAVTLYLQGYNQTTAPTRGTGVVWWAPIKASDVVTFIASKPLFQFSTGIGFAGATTPTGAVAPTTAPDVVAYYK